MVSQLHLYIWAEIHDIRSLVTSSRDSRGGKAVGTALAVSEILTNDLGLQLLTVRLILLAK